MAHTFDRVRANATTTIIPPTSWEAARARLPPDDDGGPTLVHKRPPPAPSAPAVPAIPASLIYHAPGISQHHESPGLYTQRNAFPSTPGVSQNPLLRLDHERYGLPPRLTQNLRNLGIASIYGWQSSCLLGRGFLDGTKNLVYTAPTGGGKSLVGDVLMFKRVLERKKALLVLPYVALVQEKLRWLRQAAEGVELPPSEEEHGKQQEWTKRGIRVAGYFGGSQTRESWSDVDIAVCTFEKANGMVNAAIEAGTIEGLGIVVLDELHMIDDEQRGYLLEVMATKLLCLEDKVQIVGMSATLSNTKKLADWLDGKYFQSKYKPVPVEEFLVFENQIYQVPTAESDADKDGANGSDTRRMRTGCSRMIVPSEHPALKRPTDNAVVALAVETARKGYGALVFCSSRLGCQKTAGIIAEAMPTPEELPAEVVEKRYEVISVLRSLAMLPVDDVLAKTIPCGVGFHHAGLTIQEREVVADAYDKGVLKVIVATCSLAAGINLPARRVILENARMGRATIGPAMLRQMRGRAGRKGKDEIGESYVCCRKEDLEEVEELLAMDLPPLSSSLVPEKRGIKRALLEVIGIRLATHADAVQDYVRRTLLYHTVDSTELKPMIASTLRDLVDTSLITLDGNDCYAATLLGSTIVASGLSPDDGLFMYAELTRALESFVMDGEMHVFYMFTPFSTTNLSNSPINWPVFFEEISKLDDSGLRVMRLVGCQAGTVGRKGSTGEITTLNQDTPREEIAKLLPYHRFFAALQLRDLCREIPIPEVSRKYGPTRGQLQQLLLNAESTAASVVGFCQRMGWGMLAAALEHMRDRLRAGARADLLELARIPFVKSRTARVLWENGIRSMREVAEASVEGLTDVLVLAQPRRGKTMGKSEAVYRAKMRERAEVMSNWASRTWERERRMEEMNVDY